MKAAKAFYRENKELSVGIVVALMGGFFLLGNSLFEKKLNDSEISQQLEQINILDGNEDRPNDVSVSEQLEQNNNEAKNSLNSNKPIKVFNKNKAYSIREIKDYFEKNENNEIKVENFIETIRGQKVSWKGYILFVLSNYDKKISVGFSEDKDILIRETAFIQFEEKFKDKFLDLNEGDYVLIEGKISEKTDDNSLYVDGRYIVKLN